MNDTTSDLRRLVEGLYLRTLAKKIDWTYNQSTDSCEASLGDGYVQIVRETDEDGDYYSYIKILNSLKQVIDNIYGGTLGQEPPANTPQNDYWTLMGQLREAAERQALGADKVISSILTELEATDLSLQKPPF
jgi:hypothetical protein